ncbi:MAG TPA: class I SAM-dependent methyltransferase, partial [Thermoanaerobaculia bacterium]|nr:class I SAM-dependent methyltransferase [Thermoanaerobaculia bacterium]
SRKVLPIIGGVLTGNRRAYDYLDKSAGAFPCGDAFVAIMRETGAFEAIEHRAYTGGIAYAYRGVVR